MKYIDFTKIYFSSNFFFNYIIIFIKKITYILLIIYLHIYIRKLKMRMSNKSKNYDRKNKSENVIRCLLQTEILKINNGVIEKLQALVR